MFLKYNFKLLSSKDYFTGNQLSQKDNEPGSEISWGSSSMIINSYNFFYKMWIILYTFLHKSW